MNVITAVSSKGGVTKTTLVSNLSALLADSGYRVLAIDADNTQPALSSHYPIVEQAPHGLIKLIKDRCLGPEVISKTSIDGLDIVVSDDRSDTLSEYILHEADGRYRIRQALTTIREEDRYDFVMIDTRGAKGAVLDAAMLATDIFLAPVSPDIMSAKEFYRGTVERYREIKESAKFLNILLGPLHVLFSRVDRTVDAKDVADSFRAMTEGQPDIRLLETQVPTSTVYKAAASAQMPVHLYEPTSNTKRASARDTMMSVLEELFAIHNEYDNLFQVPEISPRDGDAK